VPRWRHNGGLPGIAPQRLSGKMTAPFPVSGMIRSIALRQPAPMASDKQQPNRYDEREIAAAAEGATAAILADVAVGHPARPEHRRVEWTPAEYPISSGFFQCKR